MPSQVSSRTRTVQARQASATVAAATSERSLNQRFALLAGYDDERQAKRARFSSERNDDDDDEVESTAPWYDRYLELQGDEGIHRLTNFTPTEFNLLWHDLKDYICSNWNVGQGRKSDCTPRDCLFQTIVALKHCGTWDIVATLFSERTSTFERRVLGMLGVLQPYMYECYVSDVADKTTMLSLVQRGRQFAHYPYARYATDVTFHHTNIPSGSFAERKKMYSEKHGMYGHKVEVSVLPNGLAIGCTVAFRGGLTDIDIFKTNRAFHFKHLAKMPAEQSIRDEGRLVEQFPGQWALLADKGYQGIVKDPGVRGLTPQKKPANGNLTVDEQIENRNISSDRVIVENYFGRMKTLWGVCNDKYRWAKASYDLVFKSCMALTNVHVRYNPLRREDGDAYVQYVKRVKEIGEDIKKRKNENNKRYREARRARLSQMLVVGPTPFYDGDDYDEIQGSDETQLSPAQQPTGRSGLMRSVW